MQSISCSKSAPEEMFATKAGWAEEILKDEASYLQGREVEEQRQVGVRGAPTQKEVEDMA